MKYVLALFIAVIYGIIFNQYSDCRQSGGSFVRGIFWFECINTGATK